MLAELKSFYMDNAQYFKPKGNGVGQSMDSRLAELALVGDKYLSYRISQELILSGLSNSQATIVMGQTLSNRYLSDIATQVDLPVGVGSHANGTLLEAMVGYWILSSRVGTYETMDRTFCKHQDAFEGLISYLVSKSLTVHRNTSFMDMFMPANQQQSAD